MNESKDVACPVCMAGEHTRGSDQAFTPVCECRCGCRVTQAEASHE